MKRRVVGVALFCLVLLAAIFAGYWDMLSTEKTRIASQEAAGPTEEMSALADRKPAPAATVEPAPPVPGAAAATASTAPTFDILRVEPDGSTVMAGKAPAGATVRLTDGKAVLGEETSGPAGDFAIVLDKPLPVGEHQIRIEATGADGVASISKEAAIVSVPERGRESELLAMVESPDRPSRLISVPKGEPAPAAGKDAPTADTNAPAGQPVQAPADSAGTETGSTGTASTAPAPEAETPAARDAAATSASPSDTATPGPPPPAGPSEGTATSEPAPEPARSSNLVTPSALAVEAVEIEDETIYVAGRAPAGPTIRVYVDNVFLAEDAGRRTDRFLVSTRSPVLAGQHMVRADQVAPDGSVLARVEVPFLKPEGRSMSAVAGSDVSSAPGAETPAGKASTDVASAGRGSDPASGSPASDPSERRPSPAGPSAVPGSPSSSASAPASSSTGAPTNAAPADRSEVATARQEPLQAAGARVIIRRGDTLWRISREAYGQGARYTTIYLANGDQIRDPDRIYPGQVFRMPESRAD